MELKDYQRRALDTVRDFLDTLSETKAKFAGLMADDPDLSLDFVRQTWKKVAPHQSFQPRKNGIGDPLPTFCLKVPTGGGKTLLATRTIDLVNTKYRKLQTGLVLWIVPSNQIYRQTIQALKDRDHPYRQYLDIASGNRTLILEKTSGFSPQDVDENLCVLMLMLPSANRQTKEQLRMFRDSGGFDRFFPADDDIAGHEKLRQHIPNLDTFEKTGGFWGKQIKTSLGNTLRKLNPLIILDEGHKAYSENARKTLEGFNPCLIVELTATPPKEANVLVDVKGKELLDEEMIKLDLHLQNRASPNWKDTLLASIEHRDLLEHRAIEYEADTNEHIRPICLIQVERTGKDQRKPGLIHADDAKEYLLMKGIPAEQIAIKSSTKDELKEIDDAGEGGLLSRECPIRYIITKQALQEGWDCPFAYVLTILTNPSSRNALTQLVGRILRQPYARKTGVPALDESYVFCFAKKGRDLLEQVRKGFGMEGLGDLRGRIVEGKDRPELGEEKTITPRSSEFQSAVRKLVLPAFFIKDKKTDKHWRLVHHEADILSRVPWDEVDVSPLYDLTLNPATDKDIEILAGLDERILGNSPEDVAEPITVRAARELDHSFVAAHLLDVMPNPWRGNELSKRVFEKLLKKYDRELVTDNFVFVVEELRKQLEKEKDRLSEATFRELLQKGTMRFMVVMNDLAEMGFQSRLPSERAVREGEKRATRMDGNQYELSLFDHEPEAGMNQLELKVASYLDEQEKLFFWYRNPVRRGYAVQGWKRQKVFADFILTLATENADAADPFDHVFVLETKGIHLKRNADTDYKRSVFDLCNEQAARTDWSELVKTMRGKQMSFEIVDEEEWQARLNEIFEAA